MTPYELFIVHDLCQLILGPSRLTAILGGKIGGGLQAKSCRMRTLINTLFH